MKLTDAVKAEIKANIPTVKFDSVEIKFEALSRDAFGEPVIRVSTLLRADGVVITEPSWKEIALNDVLHLGGFTCAHTVKIDFVS